MSDTLNLVSFMVGLTGCCDISKPSGSGIATDPCRLAASDMTKRCADGHADACGVALPEHISCHHFTGNKQIRAGCLVEMHGGLQIGLQAQISEGNARSQRVGIKRRFVYGPCPMAFVDIQANRVAV